MTHYTFKSIDYYEIQAPNAREALNLLRAKGIYPDEYRNDNKYDDDWHNIDYVDLD